MDSKKYLQNFVLVRFRSGGGRRTKKDNVLTAEVIQNHQMADGQANVSIKYFADDEFAEIDRLNRERRAAFKSLTVGWLDESTGMIPAADFVTLDEKLREYTNKIEDAVSLKVADWNGVLERARAARNGNFDINDYPTDPMILHSWYSASWNLVPHPTESSLAEGIADALNDEVKQRLSEAQADMQDGVEAMKEEIAERILTPLDALADKCRELDEAGDGSRKRVHKAMFKHIRQAVEQLKPFLPEGNETLKRAMGACEALSETAAFASDLAKNPERRKQIKNLAEKSSNAVSEALKEVFA